MPGGAVTTTELQAPLTPERVEAPVTLKAYLLCIFASFGGIFFGYDSGYMSGCLAMPYFIHVITGKPIPSDLTDPTFVISSSHQSLITSILSAGTFFGALIAGDLADYFGRRVTIVSGCGVFIVGCCLQTASAGLGLIVAGRLISGFGVGFISAIIILYMSEVAPRKVRGAIVSGYQFCVTVGLLLASCVVYATENRLDSGSYRIPIGVQFAWALILGPHHALTTMDIRAEELRARSRIFRVLIVGRRNAGKTTILKKMAGAESGEEPEFRDQDGGLLGVPDNDDHILKSGLTRGMSMIEWEIRYPSNPYFVFHDSRGIESGPESELGESSIEHIWSFIKNRRARPRLRDQIHAIWFCLPMDNPRVPSESFELAFFKRDVGVPVIIVLTKYEALVERVKDKLLGREPSKEEVRRHAQSNIMKPIRRAAYPPAGYVQTHHHGDGCDMLSEKTHETIRITGLAATFAMAQQASALLLCQQVFQNALSDEVMTRFGQMLQRAVSSKHLAEELTDDALQILPFWRNCFFDNRLLLDDDRLLDRGRWIGKDELIEERQLISGTIKHWLSFKDMSAHFYMEPCIQFIAVTCILGIWTAKRSWEPWNFLKGAIERLDSMPEFRETVLTSVKKTLKDSKGDRKGCSRALAELVVRYADELFKSQPLESCRTASQE